MALQGNGSFFLLCAVMPQVQRIGIGHHRVPAQVVAVGHPQVEERLQRLLPRSAATWANVLSATDSSGAEASVLEVGSSGHAQSPWVKEPGLGRYDTSSYKAEASERNS